MKQCGTMWNNVAQCGTIWNNSGIVNYIPRHKTVCGGGGGGWGVSVYCVLVKTPEFLLLYCTIAYVLKLNLVRPRGS